jgi:hypothetical protein
MKRNLWIIVALELLPGQALLAAVTFTVTPTVATNEVTGLVTLQVEGLTNGETVLVEKFLDGNANGTVDAGDWRTQQFTLTDGQAGMVIGGVTNINVPGDTGSTAGSIRAELDFQSSGVGQQMLGKYLFRLSSPTAHFGPITNLFTVTTAVTGQSFTGAVQSSAVNVPNASVMLLTPMTAESGGVAVIATIADNAGRYSISVAPGTYQLWTFKSNYVTTAPQLTLGAGTIVSTNLNLLPATYSIAGKVVDTNNPSLGLPGVFVQVQSTNRLFAVGFTDANGDFSIPVTASRWRIKAASDSLNLHGYLRPRNYLQVDTTSGNVTGVTIALPKGTALVHGSVRDQSSNGLVRVNLHGSTHAGSNLYEAYANTDRQGNYVMAVHADVWYVFPLTDSPGYESYLFSSGDSTNISAGQAVERNFFGILATHHITGYVKTVAGNPFPDAQLYGFATIDGMTYNNGDARSDSTGYYSMNVANGTWTVGICCSGCDPDLSALGYQCPSGQSVTIFNNNGVVNITLQPVSFEAWQTQYFGSPGDPKAAPGVDADGTGQTNWFKYVAGLDPTNPASVFVLKIANVAGQPNQKMLMWKPWAEGRTYTPLYRTNLVSGASWGPLPSYTGPTTNSSEVTVTDTAASEKTKFYDVQITLP